MPAPTTTAELLDLVRKSKLLANDAVDGLVADESLPADPAAAADVLVGRRLLTRFQADQLLRGHRGFRLGQYTVLDLLGQGMAGTVYTAEHVDLGRRVALWIHPASPDGSADGAAVERFVRWARAMAALDHPNVVRLYHMSRQDQVRCLVLECVDGPTLESLVRNAGPVPPATAVSYLAQAAAGLQHIHAHGLVHGGVRPAKLAVTRAGTVKLLDAGLAEHGLDPGPLTCALSDGLGGVAGEPADHYDGMAPEVAATGRPPDARADLYGLGVVGYFLLTGRPPFDGTVIHKLMARVSGPPPAVDADRPDIPPGLAAVVGRLLAPRPDDRYRSADELSAALAYLRDAMADGR